MSYTSFIHIDSSLRDNRESTPPNNYKVPLPDVLRRVREVEVFRAEIPSTIYDIDAPKNLLDLEIRQFDPPNTSVKRFTIPPGSYSATTLVAALNEVNAVNTIEPGLSFAFSSATGKLRIAHSGARAIKFRNAFYSLGIDTVVAGSNAGFANPLVADAPVRLAVATSVFLAIPELSHPLPDIMLHPQLPSTSDVIARFQLTAPPLYMNFIGAEGRYYLRQYAGGLNVSSLTIRLVDSAGNLLNFNGADHRIFLRVVYEDH